MSNAFLAIAPIRNPIARQFPELMRNDDEDSLFVDTIDQLEIHHVYSDGRTMAHIQEH